MPNTLNMGFPYPAPTNVPDVPYYMQQLADAIDAAVARSLLPRHAKLIQSAAQSIPNNVQTIMVFGTTVISSGLTINLAAGTVTIPAGGAGLYAISGTVGYTGSTAGAIRYAGINVNGAEVALSAGVPAATSGFIVPCVHTIYRLAVADVVTLIGRQDSGGALNSASPFTRTQLNIHRIAD